MKKDKIKEAQMALQEEDYNEVKDKLNDLKGQESVFKEAAKDLLNDASQFYISLVEETLQRMGYTSETVKNVHRKAFKNNIDNSYFEMFFTKDNRIIMIGTIKIDGNGIRIEVKSDIYKEPVVQVIKYE